MAKVYNSVQEFFRVNPLPISYFLHKDGTIHDEPETPLDNYCHIHDLFDCWLHNH